MSSVLKISEAVALGIHACLIIAKNKDSKISANKIADILNGSEDHLAKVMQRLVKAHIVNSNRGPRGGFILAADPAKIFLIDIYNAIDGELPVSNNCLFDKPACDTKNCPLADLICKINYEVSEYFKNTSLASLLQK